jgi:hypothetical protein
LGSWSVGGRHRPAEAGELARDRDGDHGAALAALLVKAPPGPVQALLGLPRDRADVLGLSLLAARELASFARRSAIVGTPIIAAAEA